MVSPRKSSASAFRAWDFAAIPATIFYNVFVGRLRGINSAIDLFAVEYEGDLRHLTGAEDR